MNKRSTWCPHKLDNNKECGHRHTPAPPPISPLPTYETHKHPQNQTHHQHHHPTHSRHLPSLVVDKRFPTNTSGPQGPLWVKLRHVGNNLPTGNTLRNVVPSGTGLKISSIFNTNHQTTHTQPPLPHKHQQPEVKPDKNR